MACVGELDGSRSHPAQSVKDGRALSFGGDVLCDDFGYCVEPGLLVYLDSLVKLLEKQVPTSRELVKLRVGEQGYLLLVGDELGFVDGLLRRHKSIGSNFRQHLDLGVSNGHHLHLPEVHNGVVGRFDLG